MGPRGAAGTHAVGAAPFALGSPVQLRIKADEVVGTRAGVAQNNFPPLLAHLAVILMICLVAVNLVLPGHCGTAEDCHTHQRRRRAQRERERGMMGEGRAEQSSRRGKQEGPRRDERRPDGQGHTQLALLTLPLLPPWPASLELLGADRPVRPARGAVDAAAVQV